MFIVAYFTKYLFVLGKKINPVLVGNKNGASNQWKMDKTSTDSSFILYV